MVTVDTSAGITFITQPPTRLSTSLLEWVWSVTMVMTNDSVSSLDTQMTSSGTHNTYSVFLVHHLNHQVYRQLML